MNSRLHTISLTLASALCASLTLAPVAAQTCPGDCNGDGQVRVNELVIGTRIALQLTPLEHCPSLDGDADGAVRVNELIRAVRPALDGCGGGGEPPPGTRRFSLDPARSQLISTLANFSFPTTGFSGFVELRAGPGFGGSGIHTIDVTDASEYLSIDIPLAGSTLCVRPLRELFPIISAGVLYCDDGFQVGVRLEQDHNLGVVDSCSGGERADLPCSTDDDCPDAQCFSAARCAAAGGLVEAAGAAHGGVCNGPVDGTLLGGASAAGSVLISPDPVNGAINGLPVEIASELQLPCGDEDAPGASTTLVLTTGTGQGVVHNTDNQPGLTLFGSATGEPFDCAEWTRENGPGTLVFAAPIIDNPGASGPIDLITTWIWAD